MLVGSGFVAPWAGPVGWIVVMLCCHTVLHARASSQPTEQLSGMNGGFLSSPGRKEQGHENRLYLTLQGKSNSRMGLGADLHVPSDLVNKAFSVQELLGGQDQARDCLSVEDTD